ncbi:hypothetical protein LDENG_00179580, partial [Lucifuga dentata]
MPFGLTNAPAVFQALVNDVLRDFLNRFVFIWMISLSSLAHLMSTPIMCVWSSKDSWRTNCLSKLRCEFHVSSVKFLGYIIESGQVKADPDKIRAVAEWPKPESRKQLQHFLGYANFYRHFIRNYSRVASSLTWLTSPNTPFVWLDEADLAFNELKWHFF